MRLHAVVVALAVAAPAVANPLWDPLGLFGTGNTQDPHQGEAGSYVPTVQTVLSTNNGILGFGRHTYTNLITSSVWQAAPKATPKPPAANPPPAAQPTPPPVAAQPAPTPAPKPPSVAPPAATQQVQPPAQPAQQQPAQQPAQQQPAQQQPSQQAAAQATQNPLPQVSRHLRLKLTRSASGSELATPQARCVPVAIESRQHSRTEPCTAKWRQ